MDLSHGLYNYEGKTLWASVRMVGDSLLTGYRITQGWAREHYTYFAVRFSRPVRDYGCKETVRSPYRGFWRKFDTGHHFPEMAGRGLSCWFDFDGQRRLACIMRIIDDDGDDVSSCVRRRIS